MDWHAECLIVSVTAAIQTDTEATAVACELNGLET
jgi:hypothetical protein